MLLQFSVSNFRSIRERVSLSMRAAEHTERLLGDTFDVPGVGKVLRVAAVYGPNASGKTALLDAISAMFNYTLTGAPAAGRDVQPAWSEPHLLHPQWAERATAWECVAFLDGRVWTYSLSADRDRVHRETLHVGLPGSEALLFERTTHDRDVVVEWGSALKAGSRRLQFLRFVAEGCRPEQPLLTELRDRNAREFEALTDWIGEQADVGSEEEPDFAVAQAIADPPFLAYLVDFLHTHDLSIEEVVVRSRPGVQPPTRYVDAMGQVRRGDAWLEFRPRSSTVFLDQEQLSDGTRRLIELAGEWYDLIGTGGGLLLIDELDRSLHAGLTRRLVRSARNHVGPGQLIFTTHDVSLLDPTLLAADSVWFVDKDDHGASRIYSLAEFDPQQLAALGADLDLGYLQGRFGAVPSLSPSQALLAGES